MKRLKNIYAKIFFKRQKGKENFPGGPCQIF